MIGSANALKVISRANPRRETTSMPINFPVMPVSRHFLRKAPINVFDEQVRPNSEKILSLHILVSGCDMRYPMRWKVNGSSGFLLVPIYYR